MHLQCIYLYHGTRCGACIHVIVVLICVRRIYFVLLITTTAPSLAPVASLCPHPDNAIALICFPTAFPTRPADHTQHTLVTALSE